MNYDVQTADPSQSITQRAADNIRILSAAMVEKAKSGHPGGAMGGADFIHILFTEFLEFDPSDMAWPFRDRFFLDPGHMSAMLYSVQHLLGNFSTEDIQGFRQWGSPTPGHPELNVERGIENTSGPLGQGHAFGVGAAIAERFLVERFGDWMAHRTFIYISDGGIQEEISQGVGRTAGFLGLGNVVMFYDSNDIQLASEVSEIMDEDTAMKYEAWGWHVVTIDGNDSNAIRRALRTSIEEDQRPSLIIGKTIMGKGVVTAEGKPYEGEVETHGKPLGKSAASFEKTVEKLGGNPEAPFAVFPDVADFYKQVIEDKIKEAAAKKAKQAEWAKTNAELAQKLDLFLSGKLPEGIDFNAVAHKASVASRSASGAVLGYLYGKVENLIVSSADLSVSDKTDVFLSKTTAFRKGDFSGSFLQAGVSELTMSSLCTGMALHGGIIPVCATFFVFSDYMKPTLRLAALMEQPVKFIWTHDAFRVGEDGPTHQPVEQEAQVRLLEQLKNHSGQSSFLVLRPADGPETSVAWKMALENSATPTGMIFSRQNIEELPAKEGSTRYQDALAAEKGAYIVQDVDGVPDVILVANGSEVSSLLEGSKLLVERDGLKVRLVSAISEGRFRAQDAAYQEEVLPASVPTFGMTAGLPTTLRGLVGPLGEVFGLDHFGHSAPYKVLDEKLGFTAENVYEQVTNYLKRS